MDGDVTREPLSSSDAMFLGCGEAGLRRGQACPVSSQTAEDSEPLDSLRLQKCCDGKTLAQESVRKRYTHLGRSLHSQMSCY